MEAPGGHRGVDGHAGGARSGAPGASDRRRQPKEGSRRYRLLAGDGALGAGRPRVRDRADVHRRWGQPRRGGRSHRSDREASPAGRAPHGHRCRDSRQRPDRRGYLVRSRGGLRACGACPLARRHEGPDASRDRSDAPHDDPGHGELPLRARAAVQHVPSRWRHRSCRACWTRGRVPRPRGRRNHCAPGHDRERREEPAELLSLVPRGKSAVRYSAKL